MQQAYLQVGYDCKDYRFSLAARRFSREEMLDRLRRLFKERGHLSNHMIDTSEGMPSGHLYRRRFGSLFEAYRLIGYRPNCNKHPNRPRHLSSEDMLEALRRLLKERGRVSQSILRRCGYVPSPDAYARRFGSLMKAYRLIGFTGDKYSMLWGRPRGLSTGEMLKGLRKLLREHGFLSLKLINDCKQVPSTYQYDRRFRGIMKAYELIGYKPRPCAHGGASGLGRKRG
jgi:hypothetical protein